MKPISKTKSKGRFRIDGPIDDALESVLQNEQYLSSLMSSCVDLSDAIGTPTKGGILMYNQKTMAVLQINGQWFEFNPDIKPMNLLSSIVGDEWARVISEYAKVSLERIKEAKTFDETKPWNTPIILVANPEFERAIDELQKLSTT